MTDEQAKKAVHQALQGFADPGELIVSWCIVMDVAGPNNHRYLYHRGGGGLDGTENPISWTALGMLEASAALARAQITGSTMWAGDDDEEDEDEDG